MTNAKHTPGPWYIDDEGDIWDTPIGTPGQLVALCNAWEPPNGDAPANARLIAAAPELLDAVMMAPVPGRGEEMMAFRDRMDKWIVLRDLVIAKATGAA